MPTMTFPKEPLDGHPWWPLCLLAVVSATLFLPGLGARDFWAPGEPIYAETLRVMFSKGEWIVPTLNGQLFTDKPVLYYWLALIVSKLAGGVSEWTVRLPTAFGGAGMVLVTYLIGKRFFSWRAGLFAGVILATCYRVFWEARFLRLDTVLSFFLLLGFYFFLRAWSENRCPSYYLLSYACFALATLTKGPLGLVIPALTAVALLACSGRWGELRRMHLISGALLVAAIVSPWLILLHLRGQDQWARDFLLIHNIQNYALEPIGHVRPLYFYFVNLPLDFLPWTVLIPSALIFYYPWRQRLRDPAVLALTCWFAVTFGFFSISKSKIAYYLLPLIPALALLLGCYLDDWLRQGNDVAKALHRRISLGALWLLAGLFFIIGVVFFLATRRIEPGLMIWAIGLGMVMLSGGAAMQFALWRQDIGRTLVLMTATFCVALFFGGAGIMPYFDKYKSPRPLAEYIKAQVPSDVPMFIFRSTMNDFNYYAQRDTIEVIDSQAGIDNIEARFRQAYLLVAEKDLKYIDGGRLPARVTERQVGDRKWVLMRLFRP